MTERLTYKNYLLRTRFHIPRFHLISIILLGVMSGGLYGFFGILGGICGVLIADSIVFFFRKQSIEKRIAKEDERNRLKELNNKK